MSEEEWDMILSAHAEYCSEEREDNIPDDALIEANTLDAEDLEAESYNSLVKKQAAYRLSDSIKIGFIDILHSTRKAILFDMYSPDTGEAYEQWIPKSVCSNMNYNTRTVYIWNDFAKDNIKDWYKSPLKDTYTEEGE